LTIHPSPLQAVAGRLVVSCHYSVTMAYSIAGASGPVTTSQGAAGRRVGISFAMSALQGLIPAWGARPERTPQDPRRVDGTKPHIGLSTTWNTASQRSISKLADEYDEFSWSWLVGGFERL
jgi:hypothetical protein